MINGIENNNNTVHIANALLAACLPLLFWIQNSEESVWVRFTLYREKQY